jgi:hypothetical protein
MKARIVALALVAGLACKEEPAGLCDVCQTLWDGCLAFTPGITGLEPGMTRETIRCFGAGGAEIPCVCCDDPGVADCAPPLCSSGLECHLATDGIKHCFEVKDGVIDGVCP